MHLSLNKIQDAYLTTLLEHQMDSAGPEDTWTVQICQRLLDKLANERQKAYKPPFAPQKSQIAQPAGSLRTAALARKQIN